MLHLQEVCSQTSLFLQSSLPYIGSVLLSRFGILIAGLLLQLAAVSSDRWVELRRPLCYKWMDCLNRNVEMQEVAHAGLWQACYMYVVGSIPELQTYSDPYCSKFVEDIESSEWLAVGGALFMTSGIMFCNGMLTAVCLTVSKKKKNYYLSYIAFVLSGTTSLLGALVYFFKMGVEFLVPYDKETTYYRASWGFFFSLSGSALMIAAGSKPLVLGRRWSIDLWTCSRREATTHL
uniref:Uncharacterized protein n=1 Tax=Biomphalaria glabrata TaxID=6526 RepID=A0A2C9LKD5_BIOGL